MGKPATLLERLCDHVLSFDTRALTVEHKDGREWVFATFDGINKSIASFPSHEYEAKELRLNLIAAAKKPIRALLCGQAYVLKAGIHDSFGEDGCEVIIEPLASLDPLATPQFTAKQGQYLAYIYNYTKMYRQAPSEPDLERYFRVSPPAIHDMIKTLQRNGLIERTPGQARSIRLLVKPEHLPRLV